MKKGAAAAKTCTAAPTTMKKKAAAATPAKKTTAAKLPTSPSDTRSFVPKEPTAIDRTALTTTDAKGKLLSAGEIAFRQRSKECGNEGQQDKAKGTLPTGEKWPDFWSACNTRLKAHS